MSLKTQSLYLTILFLVAGSGIPAVQAQDDLSAEEMSEEIGGDEEVTDDFGDLEDFSNEEVSEDSFDDEAKPTGPAPTTAPKKADAAPVEEEENFDEAPAKAEAPAEAVGQDEPLEELAPEDALKAEEPTKESLEAPPVAEPNEPEGDKDFFAKPHKDEPNLDYENQLHEIYKKFYSQKTSDEDWNALVGERKAENYGLQNGDNLWNVSKTIFGDGNYWPKVWSLNSSITNPHLIKPNNTIRFVLGDESGPPVFTVTEEPPAPEPPAEAEMPVVEAKPEKAGAGDEPDIPPPLVRSRPVLMKIPPSFPPWQVGKKQGDYDELGIDYGKRKITEIVNKIPLASYVVEDKLNSIGLIHEVEAGSKIASAYQYLYVLVEPGTAGVGDTLMVYRDAGEVESVHKSIKGFLGYSVEIQGEIQLVERLPDSDDVKGRDLFRAVVSRVVSPVTVGSSLTKGTMEYFDLREKGPRSQVVAQIVGGQYFNRRQVYGSESIAFLNRGSNDGLKPGDLLSIRENRLVRNEETAVKTNVRPIGWLKVIKVTPNLATSVILRSWSDVVTGDVTGAGDLDIIKVPAASGDDAQDSGKRSLLDELDGGN